MVEQIKDDADLVKEIIDLEKNDDKKEWRARQDADFDLWALKPFKISKTEGAYDEVTTNKPRVFSDKLTDEMASASLKFSIPLYGDKEQRKEDAMTEQMVYGIWTMINENTIMQPLPQAQMAWDINNRGVIVLRFWIYEEEESGKAKLIPDLAVWDGRHTYWSAGSRGLLKVVKVRWASADELADQYGDDKIKRGQNEKGQQKVHDGWDKEREVVVVGTEVVFKQSNPLHYIPVGIFPAGNTPFIQSESDTDTFKYWGESCFARNRAVWPNISKLQSFDMTQVGKATHTPVVREYDSTGGGSPPVLNASPWQKGADILIDVSKKQKIYPLFPPPTSMVLPHLYAELGEDESTGSAAHILYGRLDRQATAQGTALLIHAGMGTMKNGLSAMERAFTWLGNEIPRQYKLGEFKGQEFRGFEGREKAFTVKVDSDKLVTDKRVVATLKIEVPQDELQNADIAERMVKAHLMSAQTAMDKYLGIEDTDAQIEIIDREMVRNNTGIQIMEKIQALIKDDPKGNRMKIIFLKQTLDMIQAQLAQQMATMRGNGGTPQGNLAPRPATPETAQGNRMIPADVAGRLARIGLEQGR